MLDLPTGSGKDAKSLHDLGYRVTPADLPGVVQVAFLGECRRVLVPGGRLLLTTPNLLSLRGRVAFMLAGNARYRLPSG